MNILVNDHAGHSFTLQLSRKLASLGYNVLHSYSTSFQSPKGDFQRKDTDAISLTIFPITNAHEFKKYSLIKRRRQEIEYAKILINKLVLFKPDIVLTGNTPLFVQAHLQDYCKKNHIKFIYWCQDIYSFAIEKILRKKIGLLCYPLWYYFTYLEKKLLNSSDHIITITDDFNVIFKRWGINNAITCIPNWSAFIYEEKAPKINQWSQKYNVKDKICITYSGTLGLKHNPKIILESAILLQSNQNVLFIVISEGLGAEYLKREIEKNKISNILLLPFQEFSSMPLVLGAADILFAILDNDAGVFSVPSKVLTYLCSEKPIVLALPEDNQSAKLVLKLEAGYCVSSSDSFGFTQKIQSLIDNKELRKQMGQRGRIYAEQNFDISKIALEFIKIFQIKS